VASHGIKDRVAIIGMGCTPFTEAWSKGLDDLILDASNEAFASAGVSKDDVDAYWFGTAQSAMSGVALARPLQLVGKPVTRVENYCATGSEAFRQAAYAVASGAYDVAMAVGAEKVKDGGYQGLNSFPIPTDGTGRTLTAAAMFSMVAPAYANKYGVGDDEMRQALAHISWKNHYNGARNTRAQFRREVSVETICASPPVAGRLGIFDCAGVADGAAAVIVCRAEDAHRYTDKPIYVKALASVSGSGSGVIDPGYDYTTFPEIALCAADAYQQAGITDPRSQIAMAEVHDCFTPTELVLMEDLQFAERGTAWKEIMAGTFDLLGELPVNPDGGLKSFGHPVGASGLRMIFENWLQLRGEAPPERTIQSLSSTRRYGLNHSLGGFPGEMVSFVGIYGTEPDQ
jgi:acetyl-CoA C-acetyltransferase